MKRLRSAIALMAICMLLTLARTASAQITTFYDPSSFSGTETVLTFQGASEPLSEYNGVSFSQNGAGVGLVNDGDTRPFGPQESTAIDNDVNPFTGLPIEITFPSALLKVAFESRFNGYGQGLTVSFYAGDALVGTGTSQAPTDTSTSPNGWIFTGFDSLVPFDRIVVAGPNNGYVRIDNVRFEGTAAPPLVLACVAGPNPSGKNTPAANNQDGFFRVMADGGSGSLSISLGSYALANGETIKITQGGPGGIQLVNRMGAFGIRHFQVNPGPAQVVVSDGANTATAACLLRP